MAVDEFAAKIGESRASVDALLGGERSITLELAGRLASVVGASTEFWMARDGQYWDDVARVEADRWVSELPTGDMVRRGWISSERSWTARIDECFSFFDVGNVKEWRDRYEAVLANTYFRTSEASRASAGSVAAWLRHGERLAYTMPVEPWDGPAFREAVTDARQLTRVRDPRVFIPELKELFGGVGVALVVTPTPSGCPASGAARIYDSGLRTLVLSGRFLADDHLWFTLMHECAHLLLHESTRTHIDVLDPRGAEEDRDGAPLSEEAEADQFASDVLLPKSWLDALPGSPSRKDILRTSVASSLAPGIVVGQLQHAGRVPYGKFNELKRRYRWDGEELAPK
jgi:hypothetical protein